MSRPNARFSLTHALGLLPLILTLLTLPAAVKAQDYAFTTNNGTITILRYLGPGGDVTIPDTINGLPVTTIAEDLKK